MITSTEERTVFYADVLGFGALARRPGAEGAVDALSDLAEVLSSENEIARLVRSDIWLHRFGLSDSIFLVGDDLQAVCAAAAELFFNLAYLNVDSTRPVLLRGAIAYGEARTTGPLFPESGSANLVGAAVVEAVALEQSGVKGPRLVVSEKVAAELRDTATAAAGYWLSGQRETGISEILWLLPHQGTGSAEANGTMIGEVFRAAVDLFLRHARDPVLRPHYEGYLSVALKAVLRLRHGNPEQAEQALATAALHDKREQIRSLLAEEPDSHLTIISNWESVLSQARH